MKTLSKSTAFLAMSCVASNAAITLLSEDWQTAGMGTGDISVSPNADLTGWTGYSGNYSNPTTLSTAASGNVLRDQGGFGGTYGSATNAGNAVRLRSTNAAMLNKAPLALTTLGVESVTFSFDLKMHTVNYYQVVEFSNNTGFLTTGQETPGIDNAVVTLDTLFTNGAVDLWEARSYVVTDGVDVSFTDKSYFRIRKVYPNPAGQGVGGANSIFHVYDNLLITGVQAVPEPASALLGSLALLSPLRRRR